MYEPKKNYPVLFNIHLTEIPIFWANMMNNCQSEANQLELFMFLTIYGSKWNNYWTLMHVIRIEIRLINSKIVNIIQYSLECNSIFPSTFALRLNTSTSNHDFFALNTILLRLQRFAIRFNDESRSGTPLCRYLLGTGHNWSCFAGVALS